MLLHVILEHLPRLYPHLPKGTRNIRAGYSTHRRNPLTQFDPSGLRDPEHAHHRGEPPALELTSTSGIGR
jgi:hypothetical protein